MNRLITEIKPQLNRKNRFNIYLDGEYAFSASALTIKQEKLAPGIILSEERITAINAADNYQNALEKAMRFLTFRPRSEKEILDSLHRKGFDSEISAKVIERLRELGLVNDMEFGKFWQENRNKNNPRGFKIIKAELKRKGLDSETIAELELEHEKEIELAYMAARKKARSLSGLDWQTFRRRLEGHLLRRGFGYEVSNKICHQLWEELNSNIDQINDDFI